MLTGVVEQRSVLAEAFLHDFFQGFAFQAAAGEQLVAFGDIGLVVLVMVKLESFSRHVRGQRVICIRQVRQFERHDKLLKRSVTGGDIPAS